MSPPSRKDTRYSFTDAQGGALVNLIHGYTDNGDPFVREFTDQLLEEVSHKLLDFYDSVLNILPPGFKTVLRDSPQVAFFRRALRSIHRILCIPRSRTGTYAICASILPRRRRWPFIR